MRQCYRCYLECHILSITVKLCVHENKWGCLFLTFSLSTLPSPKSLPTFYFSSYVNAIRKSFSHLKVPTYIVKITSFNSCWVRTCNGSIMLGLPGCAQQDKVPSPNFSGPPLPSLSPTTTAALPAFPACPLPAFAQLD